MQSLHASIPKIVKDIAQTTGIPIRDVLVFADGLLERSKIHSFFQGDTVDEANVFFQCPAASVLEPIRRLGAISPDQPNSDSRTAFFVLYPGSHGSPHNHLQASSH
ncbi:MAG TPA: hypothetical protein PKA58_22055, partial [Polyangium sp.]|nr:hypothetical protein [Polyangium sp.]